MSASKAGRGRIIYLHGFRSSPSSFKAGVLAERARALGRGADFVCPQLPASPLAAVELVRGELRPEVEDTLVGSSLGGYYATWLAERLGCRAVLINPAVHPARELRAQVGVQTMYHSDAPFEFLEAHVDELAALEVAAITFAQRYLLIAGTNDELLDWREMLAHYPGAEHVVVEGGDHGLSAFPDYVDRVLSFARFAAARS